jgi:hypothetical protein
MADFLSAVIQSRPGMNQGHLRKGLEEVLAKDKSTPGTVRVGL